MVVEVEVRAWQRDPFSSVSAVFPKQEEDKNQEDGDSLMSLDHSDSDMRRLADALRSIKLRSVEKNPGPYSDILMSVPIFINITVL